ncbi:MAG: hypothetical protein HY809_06585 [Nitrospirae bacterium]|nr:hypothetical protein [Nitrospirota bacterium]
MATKTDKTYALTQTLSLAKEYAGTPLSDPANIAVFLDSAFSKLLELAEKAKLDD